MKELNHKRKIIFTKSIIDWDSLHNSRTMPWKKEKNPYIIWLSEIILQQTRVEQGLPYFEKFIATYPTIRQLAKAPDDEVFRLWQGLGYYARCRNMLATARQIANEHQGIFPKDYKGLLQLKGIGTYTAAAIAAFAYNLPHAVVDGNVFRVLARYFGIDIPVDSTAGKKYFSTLAHELLDKNQPAIYNQAIMDFGSLVCKPVQPSCPICPLQSSCFGFNHHKIMELPVKSKKLMIRKRYFHYFIIRKSNQIYIQQRQAKDIWQGLYEFPLIEKEQLLGEEILSSEEFRHIMRDIDFVIKDISPVYTQQLTHQHITAIFFTMDIRQHFPENGKKYLAISKKKLTDHAFPQLIVRYIKDSLAPAY